jgi:plastocyanin
VALLAVAPAQADQRIVAAAVTRYVTRAVTIAPGEPLTFANRDPLLPHDVTARDDAPDGTPLFASVTITGGKEMPVDRADALDPGSYAFYCAIHPAQMNGTLTVSGTAAEPDTTPPVRAARIDTACLQAVRRRSRASLTLTISAEDGFGNPGTVSAKRTLRR